MKLSAGVVVPLATLALLVHPGSGSAQTVKLEQPILITSAGQSAEVAIVGMVFRKLELQCKVVPLAKAGDLAGHKTLVIVPGFSSKGLGSAGVNREGEMDRVKAVIGAAQQARMKTLVLHIGGQARRGSQSDEFNRVAGAIASQLIVVRTGDEDQFFSKLAAEHKVPILLIDRMSDLADPVARLFR